MSTPLILIGCGGHARVVLDALRAMGRSCAGVAAPDCETFEGVPGLGDDAAVFAGFPGGADAALGLGGTPGKGASGAQQRRRVYEAYVSAGFRFPPVIGRGAILSPAAELADGAQVMAGAVLQPGARIGPNALVNTGACVDHDSVLESHAMVAPGAVLCGGVTIGQEAYVGAGAVVLQGIRIGARAVVAAGATATVDVPDDGYVSRR